MGNSLRGRKCHKRFRSGLKKQGNAKATKKMQRGAKDIATLYKNTDAICIGLRINNWVW